MNEKSTILVVDDQSAERMILDDLLGGTYTVQTMGGGLQALDYLKTGGKADLILLDVMMPDLDGMEVCHRLKADPLTQSIPIIFLTGLDTATDEEYCLSLGAEDFIQKPISPEVVRARVRTQLSLRHTTELLRQQNEGLEELVKERTAKTREQLDRLGMLFTTLSQKHSETLKLADSAIADLQAPVTTLLGLADKLRASTGVSTTPGALNLIAQVTEQAERILAMKSDLQRQTMALAYDMPDNF